MGSTLFHVKPAYAILSFLLALASVPAASAAVTVVSGNVYDNGKYTYRNLPNGIVPTSEKPYSDGAMCWAASASNAIQYWQDTYYEYAAEGTPTGAQSKVYNSPEGTGVLNVYNTILENWSLSSGHPYNGISWWMQGGLYDTNSYSKPKDGTGGYYTSVFGTERPDSKAEDPLANASFYDYYQDKGSKEMHYTRPGLEETKTTLQNAFATQGQAVLVGIFSEKTYYSHSITCWGYEMDDKGNITSLLVTDSDDKKYGVTVLNLTQGVGADGKVRTYLSTDRHNGIGAESECYINQLTYIATPQENGVAQKATANPVLEALSSSISTSSTLASSQSYTGPINIQGARMEGSTVHNAIIFTSEEGAMMTINGNGYTTPLLTVGNGAVALLNGGLTVNGTNSGGVKADGHLYIHGGDVSITGCSSATSGGALYASDVDANVDGGRISGAQTYAEIRGAGNVTLSGNSSRTNRKESYYLYDAGGGAVAAEDSFAIIGNGAVALNNNSATGLNTHGGAAYARYKATVRDNASVTMESNTVTASGRESFGGALAGMWVDLSNDGAVVLKNNRLVADNTNNNTWFNGYLSGALAGGGAVAAHYFDFINVQDSKTQQYVYTPASLHMDGNASVTITGNSISATYRGQNASYADESCYAHGGAIFLDSRHYTSHSSTGEVTEGDIGAVGSLSHTAGDVLLDGNSAVSDSVQYKNDTARGGAVYIGNKAQFDMTDNRGNTIFSNNSVSGSTAQGGAAYNEGTLRISGNKSVSFSGNSAAEGNDLYNAAGCTAELAWNDSLTVDDTGKSGHAVVNKGTLYLAADSDKSMTFINASVDSSAGKLVLGTDAEGTRRGNGKLNFTDGSKTMSMALPQNAVAEWEHISLSLGEISGTSAQETVFNHAAVTADTDVTLRNLTLGTDSSVSVGSHTVTLSGVTIDLSDAAPAEETTTGGTLYLFDLQNMINCTLTLSDVTFDASGILGLQTGEGYAIGVDFGNDVTFTDGASAKLNLDGAKTQQVALRSGVVFFGDTAAIPEPATGTLLLSALAALCGRRRRKTA